MQCRLALVAAVGVMAVGFAGDGIGQTMVDRSVNPPPAAAEICVPDYKILVEKLQASYAEVPVSAGLGQDGNLVSVFASADTGTWTMVMTRPEGTSCVVAVGEAWQNKAAAFGPPA